MLPDVEPFVLPDDINVVAEFNRNAQHLARVDLGLLPEPFIGRCDAPIVLLNLNPGWSFDDAKWHRHPGFACRLRANLNQEDSPYPFYLLDPDLKGDSGAYSPGGIWWRKRLRVLIEHVDSLETVANSILCVEYFPDHSQRYGGRMQPIPSQNFSFSLVRSALDREAIIVVLRSQRRWHAAVPELVTYKNQYVLRNPRSPYVTPNNCDGFDAIVRRLRQLSGSA